MFLGLILLAAGAVLSWLVSGILGAILLGAGLLKFLLALVARLEPERPRPSYESGARTYVIRSTYRRT